MNLTSRQSLAEYCLRELGGGIVNIEVTPEQLNDRVDEAILYYNEFHYDGIVRDYVVKKITATTFEVADITGFSVGDSLTCTSKSISSSITSISGNVVTINVCTGPFGVTLAVGDTISNGTVSKAITIITLGDGDKGYVELSDNVVGVTKVLNLSSVLSSGDYMFNAQYQIMMSEIQNLTSGGIQYLYGMLSYLGHIDYILRKERDFRFNRRTNRVYIDVSWHAELKIGQYLALEVYKAVDDTTFAKMLNDRWLKEYTTALIKKQWGQNLKKYMGMELPGGLKYDGQTIFDEAVKDIENLRDEAINTSAPLEFCMG